MRAAAVIVLEILLTGRVPASPLKQVQGRAELTHLGCEIQVVALPILT